MVRLIEFHRELGRRQMFAADFAFFMRNTQSSVNYAVIVFINLTTFILSRIFFSACSLLVVCNLIE